MSLPSFIHSLYLLCLTSIQDNIEDNLALNTLNEFLSLIVFVVLLQLVIAIQLVLLERHVIKQQDNVHARMVLLD